MDNRNLEELKAQLNEACVPLQSVRSEVGRIVAGQKELVDRLLLALISDGHVLLEGVPGLAKTLTVKTLAQSLSGSFSRLQFTPDLLPADVIGTRIYNAADGTFQPKIGPAFYAEDGTNVTAVVVGEAVDSGDKSFSKALSIAFKYACFQVFCLPTEEMIDPDAESHEIAPKSAEEKAMDDAAEKAKKELIDASKVMALVNACDTAGVPIDKVLKLYKVDALEKLTVVKWKNALDNMDKIKAANV